MNMYYRNDLTAEELRRMISYDPSTGIFIHKERPPTNRWNRNWNKRFAGQSAGTKLVTGYIGLTIGNRRYLAHRLAWLYMTGQWPEHLIDHRNLVRDDNRFSNLRAASHPENHWNTTARGRNKYKGASFHKHSGLWHARISRKQKEICLGYYKTPEEAAAAHAEAARRLDGEFAYTTE